jgi:hypothetical protein
MSLLLLLVVVLLLLLVLLLAPHPAGTARGAVKRGRCPTRPCC